MWFRLLALPLCCYRCGPNAFVIDVVLVVTDYVNIDVIQAVAAVLMSLMWFKL